MEWLGCRVIYVGDGGDGGGDGLMFVMGRRLGEGERCRNDAVVQEAEGGKVVLHTAWRGEDRVLLEKGGGGLALSCGEDFVDYIRHWKKRGR